MSLELWQRWVYNPQENHFFWLCDTHLAMLLRKDKDGQGSVYYKHKCDYPKCRNKATTEYYPNLMSTLMEAEEDIKNNRLHTMDDKGDFHKVKNYGKRVQSKTVSEKRSKKAKLSVSSSKRSNKTR